MSEYGDILASGRIPITTEADIFACPDSPVIVTQIRLVNTASTSVREVYLKVSEWLGSDYKTSRYLTPAHLHLEAKDMALLLDEPLLLGPSDKLSALEESGFGDVDYIVTGRTLHT